MSIREDFSSYWDGNGLLAPNPVNPGTISGSDNGTLYTSEFYTILRKSGELIDQDKVDFQQKIGQCVDVEGILNRVPIGQSDGQDQVDNYYGTANGCMQVGNTKIPRQFLWALIKNLGSMNNVNPGTFQWVAFLPRQPWLIASIISAAFPSWKNPLHVLLRTLFFPLFVLSAIIIATSCWGVDSSNTDARRLSWHLWQCTARVSPLCWLASRVWLWRLYRAYGPTGMRAVASLYYQPHPDNPFAKYWITE
jgi:hypothetical protein